MKDQKKTLTDKLTAQEIKEKLEDYLEVEDISSVPLNTHLRYFTEKYDEKKKKSSKVFRLGGFLVNKNRYEEYVILSSIPDNGTISGQKKTWSVNTKKSIFYRKLQFEEIKEQLQDEVEELNEEVEKLKKQVKKLKKH